MTSAISTANTTSAEPCCRARAIQGMPVQSGNMGQANTLGDTAGTNTLPSPTPHTPASATASATTATADSSPGMRGQRRRSPQASATTARQVAAQQVTPVEAVENVVADVDRWLRTYVNFQPWVDGTAWLPAPLRPVVFNHTPVASPMQVQVSLAGGVTSAAIPFTAYNPDGDPIRYSVPVKGMPGGPEHGIVTVDNTAGTFTYTPDENFTGTDTFAFVADDETTIHVHAWDNLLNAAFGIFGTSLAGGHTDTATVTIFNGVPVAPITGQSAIAGYKINGEQLFFPNAKAQ